MTGDELDESTKDFPSLFHRNLIRRATNVTDNARLTLVKVREIPEELLTPVTTKNGVTKSVTQRFVAHSRVITRAVSQTPPLTNKLHLRYSDRDRTRKSILGNNYVFTLKWELVLLPLLLLPSLQSLLLLPLLLLPSLQPLLLQRVSTPFLPAEPQLNPS